MEPGRLKDRLDEAWQSIKMGLVRAVSIGFIPTKFNYMKDGGTEFAEWNWLELSAVTIPANQEATINVVRSIDGELLAASGIEQIEEEYPSLSAIVPGKPFIATDQVALGKLLAGDTAACDEIISTPALREKPAREQYLNEVDQHNSYHVLLN